MDRRDVLTGLAAVTGTRLYTDFFGTPENPKIQNLVVVYLYVGQLPPARATAFSEKIKAELSKDKPENIQFLLIPNRWEPTRVEAYSLDPNWAGGNIDEKWFNEHLSVEAIKKLSHFHTTQNEMPDEDILEKMHLFFGAPVVKLPNGFDVCVQAGIDLGRKFSVTDLVPFVQEFVDIHLEEGGRSKSHIGGQPEGGYRWKRFPESLNLEYALDEMQELNDYIKNYFGGSGSSDTGDIKAYRC